MDWIRLDGMGRMGWEDGDYSIGSAAEAAPAPLVGPTFRKSSDKNVCAVLGGQGAGW